MKHISADLRGAVVGFVVLLSKGLIDNDKWDCNWEQYKLGFLAWYIYES